MVFKNVEDITWKQDEAGPGRSEGKRQTVPHFTGGCSDKQRCLPQDGFREHPFRFLRSLLKQQLLRSLLLILALTLSLSPPAQSKLSLLSLSRPFTYTSRHMQPDITLCTVLSDSPRGEAVSPGQRSCLPPSLLNPRLLKGNLEGSGFSVHICGQKKKKKEREEKENKQEGEGGGRRSTPTI